ncbi:MAG: YihY family inner membrane protein [Magnetococcales bacterium]|nr:YihY family inner membrane protein [Magnetococcales bacterium]NGZ27864.1 YihY family inner membrane protein [Magnetococcales bacterium]
MKFTNLTLLLHLPKIGWRALRMLFSEQWLTSCSSLAFSTMLSIIPCALIGLGLLPASASYQSVANDLRHTLLTLFVPGVGMMVDKHLDTFISNTSSLPAIGIPALFISISFLLMEIHGTFHKVFPNDIIVPLKNRLLEFWALMTGAPILAVSTSWLFLMTLETVGLHEIPLLELFSPLIIFIVFYSIYYIFTPVSLHIFSLVIASLSATGLFIAVKEIFLLYITMPTLQNLIYGALAVIPLLQIWLLIFWMIILFGAFILSDLEGMRENAMGEKG